MLLNVKISKLNEVISLDTDKLPAQSVVYATEYGFTQSLNDAHASVQRKNFGSDELFLAEVKSKVAKRLAQIESGNVPGGRVVVDPIRLAAAQAGVTMEQVMAAIAQLAAAKAEPPKPESQGDEPRRKRA